jgi:hypothetical protein
VGGKELNIATALVLFSLAHPSQKARIVVMRKSRWMRYDGRTKGTPMKNLIILLMLVSSTCAQKAVQETVQEPTTIQEPVKIKLFIPNEDWGKICHAITRLMGQPTMEGTEVFGGTRKLSDGTEVFPHGYHGDQVVYRERSWVKGTIAVSARIKVAPQTEAIEVEVTDAANSD